MPASQKTRRTAARKRWALAAAVAAAVAFLPFVRGVLMGRVLYFRDLSVLFYPYRQYVVEGLRAGELRYWDPFVHEGVPLLYPPIAYPLDLLQALWPGLGSISLLLVLHVPLAATAFVWLARRFGLSPVAAAGGAIVYALGGFVLSSLNLYIYVQAAAWAPLVILGLRRAALGRPRALALAAMATAFALSSLGIEIALQAVVLGLFLSFRPRRPMTLLRAAAAAALGFGLAAPVLFVMRANMATGERAKGFAVDVVLNQSVHPFTLAQTLVANLYGEMARIPDRWWGSNFFDRGFPYILSLYVGATVLALAIAAMATDHRRARRLTILALLALVIALGRWGGLAPLLGALPDTWRALRYPTKAFFTVHLCVAMLAGIGLHGLARRRRAALAFLCCSLALAVPLVLAPTLPRWLPHGSAWFVAHFFPPALTPEMRALDFAEMLADAALGGALALCAALLAVLVVCRRVDKRMGAALVAVLVAGDLLRAGGGLNPMTSPALLRVAPEVKSALARPERQRIYTCAPENSPAYWEARRRHPHAHEALTLAAWADTLTPHFNRPASVPSALSQDLTSLVPLDRVLPAGAGCGDLTRLLPLLRGAGVSHVLSLDPLAAAGLRRVAEIAPPALDPLHVFVEEVAAPVPLRFVASRVRRGSGRAQGTGPDLVAFVDGAPQDVDGATGTVYTVREHPQHLAYDVTASRATAFVVLDGNSPGWRATLDGREVAVLSAGPHRAVWVPQGRSRVTMDYHPRGLRAGAAVALLSLLATGILWARGARRDAPLTTPPQAPGPDPTLRKDRPELSVITVTHNHAAFLDALFDSLEAERAGLAVEVIVVDNVSDDESAAIAGRRPWVHLLRNEARHGFATNNNRALRVCEGRHVLLLNPDTQVKPGALRALVGHLDAHPDVGICGPQLLFSDGRVQPSARRFPTLGWVLVRRTPLRLLVRDSAWSRRHLMEDADPSVSRHVDWLLGAALGVRRDLLRTVGLLDEGYFLYVEDIDWAYRARQAGWKVAYVPAAQVVHHYQARADRRLLDRYSWFHLRGMWRYFRKHLAPRPLRLRVGEERLP